MIDNDLAQTFHLLNYEGEPLPTLFTDPFDYEPHPLCQKAAEDVRTFLRFHSEWEAEIGGGKMFGVLVVEHMGRCGFLAAFSGLLDRRNVIPYFVPPIFDLLAEDSHFQREQAVISAITHRIIVADETFDRRFIDSLRAERRQRSEALQDWLFDQYVCLNARGERKTIAQTFIDYYREHTLHPQHFERNAHSHHIPSGSGECCAPKLLQYAYAHQMRPIAMAEFWQGASPLGEVRHDGQFYPACSRKCRPILSFMLQGLDLAEGPHALADRALIDGVQVLWEDDDYVAVDKPSGLLSVPGRDGQPSIADWVSRCRGEQWVPAHRLDQDTSGILVLAKSESALSALHKAFAGHRVHKTYFAVLHGHVREDEGLISLPLCRVPDDAPRQMVSEEHGSQALTDFKVVSRYECNGQPYTRIVFHPRTGRTHQLRLHAAHERGLGCPIVGDRLYGFTNRSAVPLLFAATLAPARSGHNAATRLLLHASAIEFVQPLTGRYVHVESPVPF